MIAPEGPGRNFGKPAPCPHIRLGRPAAPGGGLESEDCGRGRGKKLRRGQREGQRKPDTKASTSPGFPARSRGRISVSSVFSQPPPALPVRPPQALPVRRPEPPTQILKSAIRSRLDAWAARERGRGQRGVATREPPASQQCACAGCSFLPPPQGGGSEGRGPAPTPRRRVTHSLTHSGDSAWGRSSDVSGRRSFEAPPSRELRRCVGR